MSVNTIISFGMLLLIAMPSLSLADEWPDFPFIYAVGKAKREVPPDSATITFTVSAFSESPDAALETVQNRAGEVIKLFVEAGVNKDDIRSLKLERKSSEKGGTTSRLSTWGTTLINNFKWN